MEDALRADSPTNTLYKTGYGMRHVSAGVLLGGLRYVLR